MNRLTQRNDDGSVTQPLTTSLWMAFSRLAQYEDTGLEPDEILKIKSSVRETGEWQLADDERGYLRTRCGCCGTFMRRGYKKSKYCPNCGAEMSNAV